MGELLGCIVGELKLAAGGDEGELGRGAACSVALVKDISALSRAIDCSNAGGGAIIDGQILAREDQCGGAALVLQGGFPGLRHLVGVGRVG